MEIVVDASVAAAWFLPDEQNDAADQVLAALQGSPARAPSLFWFEVRSLFVMAEKRGRLKPGKHRCQWPSSVRFRLLTPA